MESGESSPSRSHRPFFPAEFDQHSATLLLFPHSPETFILQRAIVEFSSIVVALAVDGEENVVVFFRSLETSISPSSEISLFWSAVDAECARREIEGPPSSIHVAECDSDDTWARDTGPSFLVDPLSSTNSLTPVDWDFNAYGGPDEGCYWPCEKDKRICQVMCEVLSISPPKGFTKIPMNPPVKPGLVLEGGSFHCDGEGTLITTAECLLNPNRNPNLSKSQIEALLMETLNVAKVIWLPNGLYKDNDTNGHVDNFCCFLGPAHVAIAQSNDPDDPQYPITESAISVLEASTDAAGRPFRITTVPTPSKPLLLTEEEASLLRSSSSFVERHANERMAGESGAAVGQRELLVCERREGATNLILSTNATPLPRLATLPALCRLLH